MWPLLGTQASHIVQYHEVFALSSFNHGASTLLPSFNVTFSGQDGNDGCCMVCKEVLQKLENSYNSYGEMGAGCAGVMKRTGSLARKTIVKYGTMAFTATATLKPKPFPSQRAFLPCS